MFNFDLSAWILGAIPSGFWPGLFIGAVLTVVFGGFLFSVLAFLKRHFKAVLVLCGISTALCAVFVAL
jgi:hypothetical protein